MEQDIKEVMLCYFALLTSPKKITESEADTHCEHLLKQEMKVEVSRPRVARASYEIVVVRGARIRENQSHPFVAGADGLRGGRCDAEAGE